MPQESQQQYTNPFLTGIPENYTESLSFWRRYKKRIIDCCIIFALMVLLACLAIAILSVYFARNDIKDSQKNMQVICRSLMQSGTLIPNLSTNIIMLEVPYKIKIVAEALKDCTGMDNITSTSYQNVNNKEELRAIGDMIYSNGDKRKIDITFIKESNVWKIFKLIFLQ